MKLRMTNSSKNALENIKEKMIEQFKTKDMSKYKLKFTKKKEFIAVPIPFQYPAFQLFLNDKFHKSYFFSDEKWKEF